MENLVKLGDKVEIMKKNELLNTPIYLSMVAGIDDNLLRVQAPIESGKIVPLEKETRYYVSIYTGRGLLRAEAFLVDREKSGQLHILVLDVLTGFKKFQRRQYYRMSCTLEFKFENMETEVTGQGTVLDLSGGGIRFSTTAMLEENDEIKGEFELAMHGKKIPFHVQGKIIKQNTIEGKRDLFQYRLEFINLSIDLQETIIRYIFDEERKRRKKEKGM